MAGPYLPQQPAYQAPRSVPVAPSLVNDPAYADVVSRMRRAGYSDQQIEPTLHKLPKSSAPQTPQGPAPSPVAESPVTPAPLPAERPSLGLNFNALRDAGYPYQVAGPDPVQGMPPAAAQSQPPNQPPAPPPNYGPGVTVPLPVPGGDPTGMGGMGVGNLGMQPPPPPTAVDPTGMAGMGIGNWDQFAGLDSWSGPIPQPGATPGAPSPGAAPPVTPEMMAAFGGGAPAAPMGPPTRPAIGLQGQQPLPMGPTSRPAVGPNAGGQPPTAAAEPGFDYGGMGRNLLEFGLSTMAAGGQPGATVGGAIGQGGLAALKSDTERRRYGKAEDRADRAEKRADKTLSIQEKRAESDAAYRDASIKLQEMKLSKDPVSSVATRADGRLVAVTQGGKTVDLGMKGYTKPSYNATDAVDTARKLATVKTFNEYGVATEKFDPAIYNAAVKGLGHGDLAIGGGDTDTQANAIRQQFQSGEIDRAEAERRLQALGGQ